MARVPGTEGACRSACCDQRCTRTQADFGFPIPGPLAVLVIRVEHAVLAAGNVDEDSPLRDTVFFSTTW